MVLDPTVIDVPMLTRLARRDGLPNHASSVFASFSCRRREAHQPKIRGAVVKAAARVVDAADRGVGVRLLVIGEEVVTDAMAIKDEGHVLGVADELERAENRALR